jgi:hypothetical protein
MVFEDALTEACDGKMIARPCFIQPLWVVVRDGIYMINGVVDDEDQDADDWYVVGRFQ